LGGVSAGGLFAVVAAWPLVISAWDLLGLANLETWRLMLFVAGALVLATGVIGVNWKRTSPIRLIWLILSAWLVASVAVAALTGLAWLMLDAPGWKPPENLSPRHLEAITIRAFAIVAGLGGVALLVIAYRRQRTTEAGELREVTKLFNERFTAAYTELGSEHAAVRLGAVHALAHLADEAPSEKEVQMVIEVLCAYLRMPYIPRPKALPSDATKEEHEEHRVHDLEFASFREVRHTIIRIIRDHLRKPTRWRGKDFDFTGAVFDGGNLSQVCFTGARVSFENAEFTDKPLFFNEAEFTGARVSFNRARFTGGSVIFHGARFTDGWVTFDSAEFTGAKVHFDSAEFAGAKVHFDSAEFTNGTVSFDETKFTDGRVKFDLANFSGAYVFFNRARLTGGNVSFDWTSFTGARVHFSLARFTGTNVSFTSTAFIDGKVSFTGASGSCPADLLEAVADGEPSVVTLPDQWQPNLNENEEQSGVRDSG
jgi:uncharacterized protein YjbI with pentapeptide repeats